MLFENKLIVGAPLGVVLSFGKVVHLFDLAKAHGAEIGTHARKLEVATVFCLVVDVIFNINLG